MRNHSKTLFLLSSLLFSCTTNSTVHYARNGIAFNTAISFHVYEEKKPLLDRLMEEAERYSNVFDRYSDTNALYTINHTHDEVEADDILLGMFQALQNSDIQKLDCFSISMGKVKDAYQEAFDRKQTPNASTLSSLVEEAKNTSYEINGNKIRRIGNGMFDFGGCAKGYFLWKAMDWIQQEEASKYLLNLGRSSILFGDSGMDEGNFEFIPDPYPNQRFKAKNASLSTSSVFDQSYTIDGTTYSHIIHPSDGNAIPMHEYVTLVGENPFLLDIYSTAFMNMKVEDIGITLKDSSIKGFVIDKGKKVFSYGGL